jgi:hypothetical protein
MRRRWTIIVGGPLVASGLVAVSCTEFSASEPSGPGPADAVADAVSVTSDATADAAPVLFCASFASPPLFCADFDEGEPAGAGFESPPGPTVSIDRRTYRSPPASLHVIGSDDSVMKHRLQASPGGYDIRFKILVVADDAGGPINGYAIPLRLETSDCIPELRLSEAGRFVVDKGGTDVFSGALERRPVPGVWSEFRVVFSRSNGAATVRVELDGREALAASPLTCTLGGDPNLVFGMLYGPGNEVYLDDLVVQGL